jgi:hypothetical protein
MTNDLMEKPKNLPATLEAEADNILAAAKEDSGFEKLLKFKKGKFFIGDVEVPLGRQYVVHANHWTKCWIKFADGKVIDRRMGKTAEGFIPPAREELGDTNPEKWETGLDGKPRDPWSFQYLLPMEDVENGEVAIFTTASIGGRRGVADLGKAYGRRAKKGLRSLPIVRLAVAEMHTKKYGPVPRPEFEITDWEEVAAGSVEVIAPISAADDLNDEIPFA